jgi:hypothetical protein
VDMRTQRRSFTQQDKDGKILEKNLFSVITYILIQFYWSSIVSLTQKYYFFFLLSDSNIILDFFHV